MFTRLTVLSCLVICVSAELYDTCYFSSQDPALSGSDAVGLCTGTDITASWSLPFCAPDYSICTSGRATAEANDLAAKTKWESYETNDCGGDGQKLYLCSQYFPRCSDDNTVMALACFQNCLDSWTTCRFGDDEAETQCTALASGNFPTVAPSDIKQPFCSSATSLLALALAGLY